MRQDRRLNGWVALGSIIQIISSMVLLSAGIFVAVAGFLYQKQLAKIDDLQFFVWQDGIVEIQTKLFKGELLKLEFLYLALGIIVGVAGLIALIFAIVSLSYAKKRKVVCHRVALFIFSLIPLAIAGLATTYFVLEMKMLTDNIKYVLYGLMGAFGFIGLCYLLGIIFGRSEKFMSNDNNKYAFENANSMRNARADVNNNVKAAQMQYQPQASGIIQQRTQQGQARPVQPMTAQQRPAQPRPIQPQARPTGTSRPMPQASRPTQARPMPPRPMGATQQRSAQARPMGPTQARPMVRPTQQGQNVRYCPKCGKQLSPNEKICTLCGYRMAE